MKNLHLSKHVLFLLFSLFLFSCQENNLDEVSSNEDERGGRIVLFEKVEEEPQNDILKAGETVIKYTGGTYNIPYHAYAPTDYLSGDKRPIIIAFHAGGNGNGMVNFIKTAAEYKGWIVVGSDRLRNNMPDAAIEKAMENEVIDDILKNVPHESRRIYLSGFSGGALRSYWLTVDGRRPETYAGVLAFGGWLGQAYHLKYQSHMSIAIVNGSNDGSPTVLGANYHVTKDSTVLVNRGNRVNTFYFPGGHQVGPPEKIKKALDWLQEDWDLHNNLKVETY